MQPVTVITLIFIVVAVATAYSYFTLTKSSSALIPAQNLSKNSPEEPATRQLEPNRSAVALARSELAHSTTAATYFTADYPTHTEVVRRCFVDGHEYNTFITSFRNRPKNNAAIKAQIICDILNNIQSSNITIVNTNQQ